MSNTHDDRTPTAAQILRARARSLARPPAHAPPAATVEVLEFRMAQERYALETRYVREVSPLKDLTPLPSVPRFVRGIVNVRGRILPVLDLKRLFELPEEGLTDLHRVIIVEGHDLVLGLLADATTRAWAVPLDSLQPPLPTLTGIRSDYLKGVTAERLIVLDIDRILQDPRIIVHQDVDE